jgi:hypothetical protein
MSAIIDTTGLAHLVAVVERCRHDWDTPGIRYFVGLALSRHRRYSYVARIATATADDPTARTPAAILARCDSRWTGNDTEPPTPTPTRVSDLRCDRCGNTAVEPNHSEHCGRRADPGARQRAYAAQEETP